MASKHDREEPSVHPTPILLLQALHNRGPVPMDEIQDQLRLPDEKFHSAVVTLQKADYIIVKGEPAPEYLEITWDGAEFVEELRSASLSGR